MTRNAQIATTERLAHWAAGFRLEHAPSEVIERMKALRAQEMEFVELVSEVTADIKLGSLLQRVMGEATRLLNAERSTLFLNDEKTGELTPVAAARLQAAVAQALGRGHNLSTDRIEDRWLAPLADTVLFFARRPGELYVADTIMQSNFARSDECRKVRKAVLEVLGQQISDDQAPTGGNGAQTKTPVFDTFGRTLTTLAEHGKLDPYVGRQAPLQALIDVLCCRERNSAVLVGAPGAGKSALVAGLAHAIAARNVPAALDGCRVIELSLREMLARMGSDSAAELGTTFEVTRG